MGKLLFGAAYIVYAVFWVRMLMHALVWWKAASRPGLSARPGLKARMQAYALTAADIVFFLRLLLVNPLLWLGEWIFHVSFFLVLLRHLRFFLNPVPDFVWWVQTPGLIAGYLLPPALVYILVVRLLTRQERYASTANMVLLGLVLVISSLGVLMRTLFRPDLVGVKLFIYGIVRFAPAAAPGSILFLAHFILVLVLVLLLPSHIFTAPFVMLDARKRGQALRLVMHEK